KRAGSRKKGIFQAMIYGLSIIVIYVAFGLLITLLFGSAKLNELSSSGWFNFAFFILLVVFAISFFGAFEITLPSSLVNKIDEKADSGKGLGRSEERRVGKECGSRWAAWAGNNKRKYSKSNS